MKRAVLVGRGNRRGAAHVETGMNRRTFLAALASTPALAALLAACGDDTQVSSNDSTTGVPNVPDVVVLRVRTEGGFVAPGTDFVGLPQVLISGDGRVFTPAAITMIYPGPLVMPLSVRSITQEGIGKVVELADSYGLLGPAPDYAQKPGMQVADAPDTVVTVVVDGTPYEHRAYALGFEFSDGSGSTAARDSLAEFVAAVTGDIASVAGADNVGEDQGWVPTQYRFQAMPVDPAQWTEPSPTIVDWPTATGVALADAAKCATVDAAAVGALFTDANQLTFFHEGDVVYQLAVTGVLPGDSVC